jgi:hypothetical protein
MREEIAYQEMQDETVSDVDGQRARGGAKSEPAAERTARAGSPDPTRKERAYPDLPGDGTPR